MENDLTQHREHDFTLLLDGISEIRTEDANALYEAGCDDALVSVRCGRMIVSFSRDAPSLKDAVLSAIRNVKDSGIGARVFRVDACNLVTQAEIARRIERSRQLVNQYITGERGPGLFPPPACNINEGTPLWYWCEVAYWLSQNELIKPAVLREAQELATINNILEREYQRLLTPELAEEVAQALSSD